MTTGLFSTYLPKLSPAHRSPFSHIQSCRNTGILLCGRKTMRSCQISLADCPKLTRYGDMPTTLKAPDICIRTFQEVFRFIRKSICRQSCAMWNSTHFGRIRFIMLRTGNTTGCPDDNSRNRSKIKRYCCKIANSATCTVPVTWQHASNRSLTHGSSPLHPQVKSFRKSGIRYTVRCKTEV